MLGRPRVRGGVAIRGVVAAARAPALLARSEMNPARADLDAFFALAADGLLDVIDRADMGARASSSHSTIRVSWTLVLPRCAVSAVPYTV